MEMEDFVNNMKTDGISSETITTYRKRLMHLANWLHHQGLDIHQVGVTDIQAYCDTHDWSRATRSQVASVVRQYARAMLGRSNPLSRLRIQGIPPRRQQTLELAEIRKVLDACGDTLCDLRAKAAICLLVDAGLHPGEICSVLVDQADLNAMEVRIPGKTIFSTAWFSPFTAGSIQSWLDVRPNGQSQYLFIGTLQRLNDRPLTPPSLRVIIKAVGQRAGIDVRSSALRAAYIRMLLANGLSAEGMQWAARRTNGLFSGNPLTPALVDEIRAALPFADW